MSVLNSQRKRILRRDGHICQDCGVFVGGRDSDLPTGHVHHIDRDQDNNSNKNLVTLCWGCHNDRHDHYVPDGAEDFSKYALTGEDSPHWTGGQYENIDGYGFVEILFLRYIFV